MSDFSNVTRLSATQIAQKKRAKKAKEFRERVKTAPGSQPTASDLARKRAMEKRDKKK